MGPANPAAAHHQKKNFFFFLLREREFDLRPENATNQRMVGTKITKSYRCGLVAAALLNHVHVILMSEQKPDLPGKAERTQKSRTRAPGKGEGEKEGVGKCRLSRTSCN